LAIGAYQAFNRITSNENIQVYVGVNSSNLNKVTHKLHNRLLFCYTRAVQKVCGLEALHRCYAEGGSDLHRDVAAGGMQ